MTPELLRDVEALCDAVEKRRPRFIGMDCCPWCVVPLDMNQHKPDCHVLLARQIRERIKADD